MSARITIDHQQFRRLENEVRHVKKMSQADILTELGKTLLRYLFQLTPPFGKHAITEGNKVQERIGIAAIKRDFRRGFRPLTAQTVNEITRNVSPSAAKWIRRYAKAGLIGKMNTLMSRLGVPEAYRIVRYISADIARNNFVFSRRPHGIKQVFLVMDPKSISTERETAISHLGRAKAGWMPAIVGHFRKIPAWVPAWVRRHGMQPGAYVDNRMAMVNPYVEFRNSTRNAAADNINQVGVAMNLLYMTMRKQIETIMNKRIAAANARNLR